jgi:hypothetical protein
VQQHRQQKKREINYNTVLIAYPKPLIWLFPLNGSKPYLSFIVNFDLAYPPNKWRDKLA